MIDKHEAAACDAKRPRAPRSSASRSRSTAVPSSGPGTPSSTISYLEAILDLVRRREHSRVASSSCGWTSADDRPAAGVYYNTAAVIDADGTYRQFRKQHIPGQGLLGEVLLPPGNSGTRSSTRRRQGWRLHLLRPALPRGLRILGLNGAGDRPTPRPRTAGSPSTSGGSSSRRSRCQHVLRRGDQPCRHRGGEIGDNDFYGQSYFVDPEAFVGDVGNLQTRADRPRARSRQDQAGMRSRPSTATSFAADGRWIHVDPPTARLRERRRHRRRRARPWQVPSRRRVACLNEEHRIVPGGGRDPAKHRCADLRRGSLSMAAC